MNERDAKAANDEREAINLARQEERVYEEFVMDQLLAISLYELDAIQMGFGVDNKVNDTEDEDESISTVCVCCCNDISLEADQRVLPCGHLYCIECISVRCKMGLRDRLMVPAHCCHHVFPIEIVSEVLTLEEMTLYTQFVTEKNLNTHELDTDREYASMVKQMGWTQCPGCGVGIEKVSGCNWIQCLRGHKFCFACGTKWGSCKCDPSLYNYHPRQSD